MTQYDDDEAFDENGVLRDGARHRVPLQMRDSLAPMSPTAPVTRLACIGPVGASPQAAANAMFASATVSAG